MPFGQIAQEHRTQGALLQSARDQPASVAGCNHGISQWSASRKANSVIR